MTKTSHTILLLEEDDATRAFLQDNLSSDGYRITLAEDLVGGPRVREPAAAPRRSARAGRAVARSSTLRERRTGASLAPRDRRRATRREAAADGMAGQPVALNDQTLIRTPWLSERDRTLRLGRATIG
jgi:hypothetical protein